MSFDTGQMKSFVGSVSFRKESDRQETLWRLIESLTASYLNDIVEQVVGL